MDVVLRIADRDAIFALLARYNMCGRTARVMGHDALKDVTVVLSPSGPDRDAWRKKQDLPVGEDVTSEDAIAALRLIPAERMYLDCDEVRLIEAARDRGETWRSLAGHLGYGSPQALQQHYRRTGGRKSWPPAQAKMSSKSLQVRSAS